jgi:hypothetical protein
MHGDRDFTQLAVIPAGHKKDVKAFLQIAPRLTTSFEASGPELQAKFLQLLKRLFGLPDFSGYAPILGMETISRPTPNRTATRA